jgi:O-antigen ligase
MANALGSSYKIALVLTLVAAPACIISGHLPATFRKPGSIAIVLFTLWWIVCVPFSVWPGGSVSLLREKWIFSFLAFYIIASIPALPRDLKVYGGALAWSAVFLNFVLLRFGVNLNSRGSLEFSSSLSNPNIASLQLLLGLPFVVYWTRTRGFFSWRGLLGLASAVLLAFLIVTRSGSRSGLLILCALTLLLVWGAKLSVRMALLMTLAIGIAVVIPFIPSYLIQRYGTMLQTDENDDGEAATSTRERKELLRRSIILTMEHPLFGVGPGQFRVAEAAVSKDEGARALWLETHNMYTEISSETGIPGVMIYLAMIFLSLGPVWKDFRSARRARSLLERHEFARALLICACGLLINSAFTSVAYDYYWPIICSLGIAYQRIAAAEGQAQASVAALGRLVRRTA